MDRIVWNERRRGSKILIEEDGVERGGEAGGKGVMPCWIGKG